MTSAMTPASRARRIVLLLTLIASSSWWAIETEPTDPGPPPRVLIDLNDADAHLLQAVPRIGPALATRLLEYRAAHGPWTRVDELDAVKGIGPSTIQRIRPYVECR